MNGDIVVADYKEISVDYYGQKEQLVDLCNMVRKTAPWASPKARDPMSDQEVGFAIRRAVSMGLDPMNAHEVQIWKDRHGVQVQIAYTLVVEYANRLLPRLTPPQYTKLTTEQLEEEGLPPDAIAYRCTMYKIDDLYTAAQLNLDKSMFEIFGIGAAYKQEYSSQYFAPNGRTPAWKIKKRAYVDAIRRNFGEPSRGAIIELRRAMGYDNDSLRPEDWQGTQELDGGDALALAQENARVRRGEIASADTVSKAETALYPDRTRGKNKLFLETAKPSAPAVEDVDDIDFDAVPEIEPKTGAPSLDDAPEHFENMEDAIQWAIARGVYADAFKAADGYMHVKENHDPKPKSAVDMRNYWVEWCKTLADAQPELDQPAET